MFEPESGEILRGDLSIKTKKDLEDLEQNAGFSFGDRGWIIDDDNEPTLIVQGTSISSSYNTTYMKKPSGKKYLWLNYTKYSLSKILPTLKSRFNRYVEHNKDRLSPLGVNIGGLGFSGINNMEEMLLDMGIDIPRLEVPVEED